MDPKADGTSQPDHSNPPNPAAPPSEPSQLEALIREYCTVGKEFTLTRLDQTDGQTVVPLEVVVLDKVSPKPPAVVGAESYIMKVGITNGIELEKNNANQPLIVAKFYTGRDRVKRAKTETEAYNSDLIKELIRKKRAPEFYGKYCVVDHPDIVLIIISLLDLPPFQKYDGEEKCLYSSADITHYRLQLVYFYTTFPYEFSAGEFLCGGAPESYLVKMCGFDRHQAATKGRLEEAMTRLDTFFLLWTIHQPT